MSPRLRRRGGRILIAALALLLLAQITGLLALPPVERLERWLYDTRLQLTMPGGRDERVVIVDIDEKSLAQLGRWPWSRDRLAGLVDTLFEHYRIRTLGFDILFGERDTSSGWPVLQRLADDALRDDRGYRAALTRLAPELDYDRRFARSLHGRPVVLGYYFTPGQERHGQLPDPLISLPPGEDPGWQTVTTHGYGANLPDLVAAAADAGHFNPMVDPDGVTRRVSLLTRYGNDYYAPLAYAVARTALQRPASALVWPEGAPQPEAIRLGDSLLPLDEEGAVWVPYRGPAGSFAYIPAADVLSRAVPKAQLDGRIVLLGSTAPGLKDLRVSPVGSVYPGVEVHANLIAGMLDGVLPQRPGWVLGGNALALALLAAVLIWQLPRRSLLASAAIVAGLAAAVIGFDAGIWYGERIAWPSAVLLVFLGVAFMLDALLGYLTEARSKRQLAGLFGQYVPPELVEKMNDNPAQYSMAGQSREISVLFTDVRGFTRISESMDPAALGEMMNALMDEQSLVVRSHGLGTIDKFIGDALMAFWNAPTDDPDHALHAVEAALAMQPALDAFNRKHAGRGWPTLEIGVGVNSGRAVVGDMGSRLRRAYTALGDTVNLAARLEGQSKAYGQTVIIGETTFAALPDDFVCLELDRLRVVGKSQAVRIYSPLGRRAGLPADTLAEAERYHQALARYHQRDWDMAAALFDALHAAAPERKLYKLYLERIARLRDTGPAEEWDGAFTAETK